MRVLVTGAAGFIGSHVVDALVAAGHEVIALDSFDSAVHAARPDYLNPAARVVEADVCDAASLRRELRGVEAVSHQAAIVGLEPGFADASRYVRTNALGTAVLLEACMEAGVSRFVLASSMAVYGEGAYLCDTDGPQRPPPRARADLEAGRFEPRCPSCGEPLRPRPVSEDERCEPRSVYAATKLHQEHLAFAAMRSGALVVTALRYHNVYGPRMPRDTPYAGVASVFRSQIAAGRAPTVFEDGGQLRDFVHVADVARANVLAIESTEPGVGALNVGSGEPRSVLELALALSRALGGGEPVVTGRYRAGDVRHVFASSARARALRGFTAEVGFPAGIADLAIAPMREPVA